MVVGVPHPTPPFRGTSVRRAVLLTVLALLAGLLTACGGGSDSGESDSNDSFPEVSGSYGDKPKITVAQGAEARQRRPRPRSWRRARGSRSPRVTCWSPTTSARPSARPRRSTTPTTAGTQVRSPCPAVRAASSPAG